MHTRVFRGVIYLRAAQGGGIRACGPRWCDFRCLAAPKACVVGNHARVYSS